MDYSQLDDRALFARIAITDEQALSVLYDRYSRLVFSLAYQAVGDIALAEEITQDVFMRVWEKADTYNPKYGKATTWMASIARNRAIDIYRRQRVRPEGHRAAWDPDTGPDLPGLQDVEAEYEQTRRGAAVRQALGTLPEDQRLALAYAYFLGYTQREIAEELNEPLGTIKTRIRLAMNKLRDLLESDLPADG